MKTLRISILAVTLLGLQFLCSCTKEIPFGIEDQNPKIVVNSLFSTDSVFIAHISKSANVLEDNYLPPILNAEVKIFDENHQLLSQLIHSQNGVYISPETKPLKNNNYQIEVSAPNYTSVSSQETIPETVEILNIDTSTNNNSFSKSINIDLTFTDPVEQNNYYLINVFQVGETVQQWGKDSGKVTSFESFANIHSKDISIDKIAEDDLDIYRDFLIFNDHKINGQTHTLRINISNWYQYEKEKVLSLNIRLYNISKSYYNYKLSMEKYNATSNHPLAQPTQVYSNIENGIGIFAGASVSSQIINF